MPDKNKKQEPLPDIGDLADMFEGGEEEPLPSDPLDSPDLPEDVDESEDKQPEGDEFEEEDEDDSTLENNLPKDEDDDELLDYTDRKLKKLITDEGLTGVSDELTGRELRDAIRQARRAKENDPEAVRQRLLELIQNGTGAVLNQPGQQPSEPQTPPVQGQQPITPTQVQQLLDGVQYQPNIGQEELEAAISDPKKFSEVLSGVHKNAVLQSMQRLLPAVQQLIGQQLALTQVINDFYTDNPDLRPVKKLVMMVAQQMASANPAMPYEQLFQKTGEQIRSQYKMLIKPVEQPVPAKPSNKGLNTKRRPNNSRKVGTRKFSNPIDELLYGTSDPLDE